MEDEELADAIAQVERSESGSINLLDEKDDEDYNRAIDLSLKDSGSTSYDQTLNLDSIIPTSEVILKSEAVMTEEKDEEEKEGLDKKRAKIEHDCGNDSGDYPQEAGNDSVSVDTLYDSTKDSPKCAPSYEEMDYEDGDSISPIELIKEDFECPAGIKNLGATCYANSLLQALFAIPEFLSGLYQWRPRLLEGSSSRYNSGSDAGEKSKEAVCYQLQKLFTELQLTNKRFVDAADLLKAMDIAPVHQQDPQEFWSLFTSLVQDVLKKSPVPSVAGLVDDLFSGTQDNKKQCMTCMKEYPCRTSFNIIQVTPNCKTLEDSLGAYLEDEKLEDDNKYLCRHCNKKQNGVSKTSIVKLPPILVFHVLRFQYDCTTFSKKKIHTLFSFPMSLDMDKFVESGSGDREGKNRTKYELFAVVSHCGQTANGGHYVSFTKSGGRWYRCNDDYVTKMEEGKFAFCTDDERALKKTADKKGRSSSRNVYMLFYRRKDFVFKGHLDPPQDLASAVLKANDELEKEAATEREKNDYDKEVKTKTDELKAELDNESKDEFLLNNPDEVHTYTHKNQRSRPLTYTHL